jgi:hypothetical protein
MKRIGLLAGILLSTAGCLHRDDVPLVAVTGRVTRDGQPVASASVLFEPALKPSAGKLATGRTDPLGHFTLYTGNRPGAVMAAYRVTVVPDEPKRATGIPDRLQPGGSTPVATTQPTVPIQEFELVVGTDGRNNFEIKL